MKKLLFFLSIFIMGSGLPDNNYSNYFSNKRFRFDFYIEGRYDEARIIPDCLREEEYWGGSKVNLIDTLNYGNYLIKLFDAKTRELIFSKGYCDLFVEWQTVEGAKDTTARYHECILFPAPKKKAILEIYKRDTLLLFNKLYSRQISPKSKEIKREKPVETKSRKILESGNSSTCIDIIFLSEGYQAGEEEKFYSDAARFRDFLFSWQPYKRYKNKFNLTAVFAPSLDSGVDIPGQGIFLNTIADAHFYTFGIERYLTLPDLCKVYNYLSAYPVDQVCVLANSSKYGGGGIYNYYNIFTTDNERAELLFLHEFGHGFASLGDEYFSSEVAYAELGSRTIEPYEPNITNLADFTKKWKNIISDTVPIPTPDLPQYDSVVGVFEGANYTSRGFYRPQRTCAMRSSGVKQFCKVCELSIERMIHLQLK